MTKEVGFIKLDLEGGELDTLRGSRGTLESNLTLVVFENGRQASADLYGYDKND